MPYHILRRLVKHRGERFQHFGCRQDDPLRLFLWQFLVAWIEEQIRVGYGRREILKPAIHVFAEQVRGNVRQTLLRLQRRLSASSHWRCRPDSTSHSRVWRSSFSPPHASCCQVTRKYVRTLPAETADGRD